MFKINLPEQSSSDLRASVKFLSQEIKDLYIIMSELIKERDALEAKLNNAKARSNQIKSLVFAILLTSTSCMSYNQLFTIIPEKTAQEIPLKSDKVIVTNAATLSQNYQNAYKALLNLDYRIENDNKEMGYITASKMDLGDTNVRLNIVTSDGKITITSEWKPGNTSNTYADALVGFHTAYDWDRACWNKRSDKPSVAFAKAVELAGHLDGAIKYQHPVIQITKPDSDPLY
jgi:hypothetical protein